MKTPVKFSLAALAAITLCVTAGTTRATTYSGNGNTGFGGKVGGGSLSVTDDGSGGVNFSFTLASTAAFTSLGNDLVIYLDNGTGGGLSDTSGLYDGGDGGREAVSGNNNAGGASVLNFGGELAPQYGIDFQSGYGQIFKINSGSNILSYIDGAGANSTASSAGLSYTVSGDTATLDLPAADFGVSPFSGATLNFLALEVSETGFSSNEATVSLSGASGYGHTQTATSVNTFTVVPEPSSMMMLLSSCVCGTFYLIRRRRK